MRKSKKRVRIYCSPKYIRECLNERLNIMKKQAVKVYTREGFVDFLAKNYLELYFIHPFREGNSRTLREFLREYVEIMNEKLIRFGNFKLEYSNLDELAMSNFIKATVWNISGDSEKRDASIELLKESFDQCLVEYEIEDVKRR